MNPCPVLLKLYNMNGQEIETLVSDYQSPGFYQINVVLEQFPSGLYFYKIKMGTYLSIKKMIKLN